jgi:uncharacterized protein
MTASALDHPLPLRRRLRLPRGRLRLAAIAASLLLALAVILVGLAWHASDGLMYLSPSHYAWSLADYPALQKVEQPLVIHSSTGVTLVGRFFPGRYDATIVLSHGYGGDEDEMLPVASELHAAGFTVVTYNERGRDGSGGEGTWGALETKDLRSVISAVVRHPHVDPREVAEFGFSIGADISILEAAGDPRVKAVVADASWPSLSGYMHSSPVDVITRPTWVFNPLAVWLMELRTGADVGQVSPVSVIAKISPRPLLLIQGLADTDVEPHDAVINYDHARAPRQLWLVPGEGHTATVAPGGAGTSPRVAAFFASALLHAHG